MGEEKIEERRLKKRHLFSASTEITELTSGARFSTRAADLSLQGCYLDSLNPLEIGTKIRVRIMWDGAELTCSALVRDSQPGLGMGVAFTDMDDARKALLQGWIEKLDPAGSSDQATPSISEISKPVPNPETKENLALRLIDLLHKKGLLNASEVSGLLRDKI
ncbi:MAG TPA: PilZ domain-containing protein [Candidatus Saccharimonadales bacterium]|nr:PilZ domain-containing protein [Candidatus Saccharimonadales bacterium]